MEPSDPGSGDSIGSISEGVRLTWSRNASHDGCRPSGKGTRVRFALICSGTAWRALHRNQLFELALADQLLGTKLIRAIVAGNEVRRVEL